MSYFESMYGISVDAKCNLGYVDFADGHTEYIVYYHQTLGEYEWLVQTTNGKYIFKVEDDWCRAYQIINKYNQYFYKPTAIEYISMYGISHIYGEDTE